MDPTTASGSGGTDHPLPSETVTLHEPNARILALRDQDRGARSGRDPTDRQIWATTGPGSVATPPTASRIARFTVLEPIGRGGMGTVYAAYDERLDRKVAVKVLLDDELPDRHDRARFLREAQALARLSHPNVVTVHEVGEADGQLFLAMEFIHGHNVSQWLRAHPDGLAWSAAVEAFVQAGQGLAAVHQAGLVHRDLKPNNIMRRDDGVVKILDFGLARAVDGAFDPSLDPSRSSGTIPRPGSGVDLSSSLTHPGTVMGTPGYMSPEQLHARTVDARSDQFSFCVALYEALYGERPYAGRTMEALRSSMRAGRVQPAPKGRSVPAWLRTVLLRGLAIDPAARWPSMDALVEQLRRRLASRRGRWWVPAAGLAIGLGLFGIGQAYLVDVGQRCTGARAELDGIWDDARRRAVEAAILGTEASFAPNTWTRVEARLDTYADAWVGTHTEVCEATGVRGEQSDDAMHLRMGCLRKRRTSLRAAVDVLADADAEVVKNAVDLVAGLPRLARCDDLDWLEQQDQRVRAPEDPHVAAEVETLRERLADIAAIGHAGRYARALDEIEPLMQRAEALGYPPLLAEVRHRRGALRELDGEYAEAEQDLRRAHTLAVEHHHDAVALYTAQALTAVVGERLARHAEGRQWGQMVAVPLAQRSGGAAQMATSLNNLGMVLDRQGEHEQAQAHHERALAIWDETLDADPLDVATSLNNLGTSHRHQGEHEDAKDCHERALKMLQQALGPDHPDVAMSLNNLGNVYGGRGDHEQAKGYHQRALEIWDEALGSDHPSVAMSLNNLGLACGNLGEYEEAKGFHQRALRIFEEALGADHPDVADCLNNLGAVCCYREEYEEAKAYFERALRIQRKTRGVDHRDVADSLNNLGAVWSYQGKYEEAKDYFEQALRIFEEALGADHPDVADSLTNLGTLCGHLQEYAEAKDYFERALRIYEEASGEEARGEEARGADHPSMARALAGLATVTFEEGDARSARAYAERVVSMGDRAIVAPARLAEVRFVLAQALWDHRSERARARALAEQARVTLAAAQGPGESDVDLARVEAWLATHRVQ